MYETVTMTGATDSLEREQIVIPGFTEDNQGEFKFTLDATRLGMLGGPVICSVILMVVWNSSLPEFYLL